MTTVDLTPSEVITIETAFQLFRETLSRAWTMGSVNLDYGKAYVDSMRVIENKLAKGERQ